MRSSRTVTASRCSHDVKAILDCDAEALHRPRQFDAAIFDRDAEAVNGRRQFDAVIFDCDGVLVDSEGIAEEVWAEMAAEIGLVDDGRAAFRGLRGEKFATCVRWLEAVLGRPLPAGFEADFRIRSRTRFERELKPIAGVTDVLRDLQIPFCVASNGPRDKIELNLGLTGLLPLFEGRIFSAYELDVWKPDPRFYLEVAASLGFEAARCAVVEDSMPGVGAALGAGMAVFAFAGEEEGVALAPAVARVFREMNELPGLLAEFDPIGS